MPLSSVSFTGNGTNRVFTLPFGYINKQDISLTIDGDSGTYVFQTDGSVKTDATPVNGAVVKFTRVTDIDEPDVVFVDAANLTDSDLNLATQQSLFALQELKDEVELWVSAIQSGTMEGSDLPMVAPGSGNTFLVNNNSGTWVVKSLADTQAILGIDTTPGGGSNELPDDPGFPGVLTVDVDGLVKWSGIKGTRDLLNLGQLSLHDVSDYPVLDYTVGDNDIGQLLIIDDLGDGATPALPAINGSKLTGVPKAKYVRVDERKAYDTNGGNYTVANTWVQRSLTSPVVDEIGTTTITSGHLNVPAGKYTARITTKMRITGFMNIRLVTESGATIYTGQGITGQGEEQIIEVGGGDEFTLGTTDGLRVEVYSTGTWSDTRALGTCHNTADLGSNIYTILELWKLP